MFFSEVVRLRKEGFALFKVGEVIDSKYVVERVCPKPGGSLTRRSAPGYQASKFLVFGNQIVISDLGLGKDPSSDTVFTQSVHVGGTPAFSPLQFFEHGGFKDAQDSDDIYMLGKSFYYLLTGSNPQVLVKRKVNPVLYQVIERCCAEAREDRLQNCGAD